MGPEAVREHTTRIVQKGGELVTSTRFHWSIVGISVLLALGLMLFGVDPLPDVDSSQEPSPAPQRPIQAVIIPESQDDSLVAAEFPELPVETRDPIVMEYLFQFEQLRKEHPQEYRAALELLRMVKQKTEGEDPEIEFLEARLRSDAYRAMQDFLGDAYDVAGLLVIEDRFREAMSIYRSYPQSADLDGRDRQQVEQIIDGIRRKAAARFEEEVQLAQDAWLDGRRKQATDHIAALREWDLSELNEEIDGFLVRMQRGISPLPVAVVEKDVADATPPKLEENLTPRVQPEQKTEANFFGITITREHVVYVVDLSGSMNTMWSEGRTRKQAALYELMASLEALREDQKFMVVFFATRPIRLGVFRRATDKGKADVIEMIEDVYQGAKKYHTGDSTNIFAALTTALKETNERSLESAEVILLTDGYGILPGVELRNRVEERNRRKALIHTVGLGFRDSRGLLQGLARDHGGIFVPLESPGAIAGLGGKPSEIRMNRTVLERLTTKADTATGPEAIELFDEIRKFLNTPEIHPSVVKDGRAWLEKKVRSQTVRAERLLAEAEAAERSGRMYGAARKYNMLIENCPATNQARVAVQAMERLSRTAAMREALARADEEERAWSLLQMADNFARNGKVANAEDLYNRVVLEHPETEAAIDARLRVDELIGS